MGRTLITGGAGYIGIELVDELLQRRARGHRARPPAARPDTTGQRSCASAASRSSRATSATRWRAATRCTAPRRSCTWRRSSAIRPARGTRSSPRRSTSTRRFALAAEAAEAGVEHFVMASARARTTGAWPTRRRRSTRPACSPPSASTPSRRSRRAAPARPGPAAAAVTCLRFATVYGVAPRMRFDLTVNEFTRDLWADRELEVFGEQFWRPYVHVRDAARGIARRARSPARAGRRRGVQHRRHARELPQAGPRGGDPQADRQAATCQLRPRDGGPARLQGRASRRSTRRSATRSPRPSRTGSPRSLGALDEGRFPDAFEPRYRNIP